MKFLWLLLLVPGAVPAQPMVQPDTTLVVSRDGTRDFTTIQEAVHACRAYPERMYTIRIRNGLYREKLVVPAWNTHITFVGENVDSTIISYADYSGKQDGSKRNITTFTSFTCMVSGNNCTFENITFENTAGRVGQAVALSVDGDRCIFRHCRLVGNQDTHLAAGENSRQYYDRCYIEGTTDFIFGPATAYFDSCTIVSKKNSYVTAASTLPSREYGFVFRNCTLLADSEATKVYLGRPWRLYAYTAFIHCYLGGHILPEGWHNWNKPEAEKTARYFEYQSMGPGANPRGRVSWSHQLTDEQAAAMTPDHVLSGSDRWNPLRPD
jgi:pectinesterase